ncbi:8731_t:CDS:1, partial [Gigaspora margarita]
NFKNFVQLISVIDIRDIVIKNKKCKEASKILINLHVQKTEVQPHSNLDIIKTFARNLISGLNIEITKSPK